MIKYERMLEAKRARSDKMIKTSLDIINKMIKDDEMVTIAVLVKKTGFSRSFFNQNIIVHEAIEKARNVQKDKGYNYNKKVVLEKTLKKECERLLSENKLLKEEVQELNRQIILLKTNIMEKI